jgi:hypothetical protein
MDKLNTLATLWIRSEVRVCYLAGQLYPSSPFIVKLAECRVARIRAVARIVKTSKDTCSKYATFVSCRLRSCIFLRIHFLFAVKC